MDTTALPWKDFLAQRQAVLDAWPTGRGRHRHRGRRALPAPDPRGQELRQGHAQGHGEPASTLHPAAGRGRPDRRAHPASSATSRPRARPTSCRRRSTPTPARTATRRPRSGIEKSAGRRHVAPQRLPGRQPRPRRLPPGHRSRRQADPGPPRHARRAPPGRDLPGRRLHLLRGRRHLLQHPLRQEGRRRRVPCATGSTSTAWSATTRRTASRINREPFGPLTGTLVPPFISHTVAILEGLLALRAGRQVADPRLRPGRQRPPGPGRRRLARASWPTSTSATAGFTDYDLTIVFHQWMGGFPEDEAKAFAVISLGAVVAAAGQGREDHRQDASRGHGHPDQGGQRGQGSRPPARS
ncbi:MAG: hypothetical protein MZW92_03495 [Comamonadaceae bacterium]|nr:hypothetical protein [Comamonadaceae bacterium]